MEDYGVETAQGLVKAQKTAHVPVEHQTGTTQPAGSDGWGDKVTRKK